MAPSKAKPILWAVAGGAVLIFLIVAGLVGKSVLSGPDSGSLTQVTETDLTVMETRILLFNAGRVKVIHRTHPAQISRRIASIVQEEGMGSLLPLLNQVPRGSWSVSRHVGGTGESIQVSGGVSCDPERTIESVRSLGRELSSRILNDVRSISVETTPGKRTLMFDLFPRETEDGKKWHMNFFLLPTPEGRSVLPEDLKPYVPEATRSSHAQPD